MAFQEALDNILTADTSQHQSIMEMSINNFKYDCAEHGVLVHSVQFGGHNVEHITDDGQPYYQQTINRAYVELYMPREKAHRFINEINVEGTVVAEKVRYLHDDMYDTINPGLIQQIPRRYQRRHTSQETLTTLPFELDAIYNLLVSKSNYEYFLERYHITDYEDLEMVFVIDPRTGKKANAYPGLFSEVGNAIR